jgi:phage shock protein PspC (stress-responsive transcriptional regulator)
MTEHNCTATITALLDHLENGTQLPDGAEELRACTSCSELVRRAQRLGALLEENEATESVTPVSEAVASMVVSEVVRRRRSRLWWSALAILAGSIALGFYAATRMPLRHPFAVAFMVSFLLGGPMLLLMISIRATGSGGIFKRLEGRQLSGVCRGLSEAFGVPVWILRVLFIVLLFAKGAGLVIYLLLDFILPIHPADRANLLRFRLARWWKSRVA